MIISSYYNPVNKCLTHARVAEDNKVAYQEEQGDKILLYNSKDELIGINVFNGEELPAGLVNSKDYEEYLKKYFETVENPFIVGHVTECTAHPKSEKLKICQVDLGTEQTQIVCGASNVAENLKVIVAKVGAVMPNGQQIVPSKLINEQSNGMICSYNELLKGEPNQGIAELKDEELYSDFF